MFLFDIARMRQRPQSRGLQVYPAVSGRRGGEDRLGAENCKRVVEENEIRNGSQRSWEKDRRKRRGVERLSIPPGAPLRREALLEE